jgi:hypothetical protein
MAKEQQLFLNPSKISGACGRLLCCLNFEKETYTSFHQRCPKVGKKYETSAGDLKILRANMFRDSLIVGSKSGEEREITLIEWSSLTIGSEQVDSLDNLLEPSEEDEHVCEIEDEPEVTVHEEGYRPSQNTGNMASKSKQTASDDAQETNNKKRSASVSSRRSRKKKNRPKKKTTK